jgi:LuxR family maltose regulon positive regulatory protein
MRDGSRSIESSAAMVRTSARLLLGDVGAAAQTAALAAELEPDRAAPWRPIVTNALGMVAYWAGDIDSAVQAFRETVSAGEVVGNHTAAIYALGYLAAIAAERSDYAEGEGMLARAFALAARQHLDEHWVMVMAYYAQGECARARGELEQARTVTAHGLDLARRGGLRLDTVYGLLTLAHIAGDAGDRELARDLRTRAERQLAACPDPGILPARVRRRQAAGVSGGPARVATIADDLSERELEVLRLMPTNLSLREIAGELYVSFNTAKTHARNVYAKLRVGSREEAVRRARELQLL